MTNPQAEMRQQLMNALYHDDFSTVDNLLQPKSEPLIPLMRITTRMGKGTSEHLTIKESGFSGRLIIMTVNSFTCTKEK